MLMQQIEETRANVDTGEIIQETKVKTWSIRRDEEPFFMTYSKALSILYNIKTAAAIKVLWKLLDMCDFNKGVVRVTKKDRGDICQELEITGQTYYNSIAQLKELKVLEGEGGYLVLNPDIVWKGDRVTRKRLLSSGCRISIEPLED